MKHYLLVDSSWTQAWVDPWSLWRLPNRWSGDTGWLWKVLLVWYWDSDVHTYIYIYIYSKIIQPAPAWSCRSQEGPLASGPGQWLGLLCAIVLSSETSLKPTLLHFKSPWSPRSITIPYLPSSNRGTIKKYGIPLESHGESVSTSICLFCSSYASKHLKIWVWNLVGMVSISISSCHIFKPNGADLDTCHDSEWFHLLDQRNQSQHSCLALFKPPMSIKLTSCKARQISWHCQCCWGWK